MDLIKTINDGESVCDYSEESDIEVEYQPKMKKTNEKNHFDEDFSFVSSAIEYNKDTWDDLQKYVKQRNRNKTNERIERSREYIKILIPDSDDDAESGVKSNSCSGIDNDSDVESDQRREKEDCNEDFDKLSDTDMAKDTIKIREKYVGKRNKRRKADDTAKSETYTLEEADEFFGDAPPFDEKTSFHQMNLSRPLMKAIGGLNYIHPTPIQAAAIPVALMGRDICACAATGTGKTAAYMLPILERLLFKPRAYASITRVLVLVPTRELGVQVYQVTKQLAQFTRVEVGLSVGGLELKVQESVLRKNPDIVIATPGRLIDHLQNTPSFSLEDLEIFVLDEADRMLDENFAEQMKQIVKFCSRTRQTLLFSATMTEAVNDLASLCLTRPVKIFVDNNQDVAFNLRQEFVRLREGKESERDVILATLVCRTFRDHVMVFVRTKKDAHRVLLLLGLLGLKVCELHGNLGQSQRLEALKKFRDEEVDILVATDVAARGLDIRGVKTVINYVMPPTLEHYIHRVGRTARAGRAGVSVSIAVEGDRKIIKQIVKNSKTPVKSRVIPQDIVARYKEKLSAIQPELRNILDEEREEKMLAKTEKDIERGKEMLKGDTSKASKTSKARSWFQTRRQREVEKQKVKEIFEAKINGNKVLSKKRKQQIEPEDRKLGLKMQNIVLHQSRLIKKKQKPKKIRAMDNNYQFNVDCEIEIVMAFWKQTLPYINFSDKFLTKNGMAITTTFHNWCDQLRSSFQEIEVNPSDEGATALMYACQQDNVGHLEIILKRKPEAIMERDRTLKSVLHYCVENVSLNCAQIVLNAAPELLDATDEDGYTALHLAVIAGNTLLVNYLVSKSADLNKLDFEGHSVIHWGTVCGKLELLQFLLKCGAEPSTPDVHGGYPIHYAAQMCGSPSEMGSGFRRSGLDVLNALLHHHVDVNVKDHDGRQPMLWAASAGSSDAVLALTNAGASIEARDKDGLTALHCAASRGHTECLETLIELCGADVDGVDDNGCTALFYSVTLGHADATQLLLRCGASPNHQDRRGRTAAHCGAAKGQFETLRILKQHNGNLWLRNIRGDYCLHEAVNAGRKDLVKWLLSQRPDAVDSSNIDDRCSLHIAAIANNIEMCKILLDYRSLINPVMKTHKGDLMTPLDAALLKSNRGCAKYLQLHGGVPSSKLTSFFAALRGPRRTESYSDYYGSPDCKLKAPLQNRSSRSLDTSPCGYRTTTSRKVQVRIEANLSAENIREYHAYDDLLKCTYKKNKLINGNTSRNTSSYNADVVKVISYLSSDVESNLSDTCDYSLEKNYGERPRRRRRQRKRRPKRSEGNHGIYIDLPNVDTMHQAAEESGDVAVMTVPHRPMSELDGSVTTAKARAERDAAANQGHDWESIVQNRTKRTESSGNGFQEIQYQKLEAEGEEFDQGDFVPKGAELDNKTNDSIFWNGTIDGNNEDVDISVTALKEEGLNKQILGEESKLEYKNIEALAVESTDVIGKIVTKKVSQANYNGCIDDENVHFVVSAPLQKCKATYMDGLDDKTLNLSDTRDVCAYDNSATNALIILPPSVSNRYDGCHDEANHKLTRTNQVAEDENLVIGNKNEVHVDSVDEFKNKKNINEIFDTEGKKELSLTTELDTDKGVICVIIDDDKTIGMEGEKDEARKKSGSERGVMKATHRRDQNSQETQSRFECSFQVLLDDDQEEQHTTLGLNDDPTFKSSTRRTPLTPIKGGKNKTRSRIPRSTSQVHKVKNELNDGNRDVNVVSVTQAVQYSLRKYHLERRIFHALLELKRLQIRAGKSNEQILVKRLIDDYQKAGFMVGLRQYDGIYSFRHFERYLYEQLRILQSVNKKDIPRIKSMEDFEMLTKTLRRTKAGKTLFESFPDNPLFCTHGTHRCIHATHAYTGIPCAAYISKINHHMIPKTDEGICRCFLPRINSKCIANDGPSRGTQKFLNHVDPSKPVTLELIHGAEKQVISLPTDKLDKNKRYFVSFTVEGVSNIDKKSPFIAQKTRVV